MSAADLDTIASIQQEGIKNLGLIYQALVAGQRLNFVSVPASSAASGTAGQVAADVSNFYICISTNLWRRVAISAF